MILRSCIIRCLWLCFLILPTSVQAGIIGAGCISEFYRRLDRGTQMNASSLAAIEAENMAIAYGTAIIMIYLMFMTFVILTIWIFSSLSLLLNSRIAAIIGVGTVACSCPFCARRRLTGFCRRMSLERRFPQVESR